MRVTALNYEANFIDVQYSWIFSLDDDIPDGGFIDLVFPKNFYNVQNSLPVPTFEIFLGLTSSKGQFDSDRDHTSNVNIYTIQNFQAYKAGTLISLKVYGVKNPPVDGLTNYFEIQSRTSESFQIDYKRDIAPFTIIRAIASGQIQFNYFRMTPDNGSPGVLSDDPTK